MNKFAQLISSNGSSTLKRRANAISQNAEIAQQNLVNHLKQEKLKLELKIDSLTDLAPNDRNSLNPGNGEFDPVAWVNEVQSTKQELYMTKIQLNLAIETFNEWFNED